MKMIRMVVVALALAVSLVGCDACKRVTGSCCKVCKGGKACGDSCIASGTTCNVGNGCACNGLVEDVLGE
jgi:hypothetical protein